MKLPRFRPDRRVRTKEILDLPKGEVKPFDLKKEFTALKSGLENLMETWAEWPHPPEEFWKSLGYLKLFFSEQEDVSRYLQYTKVHQTLIEKGKSNGSGLLLVFHLMQLFPDERKDILKRAGVEPAESPEKVYSGELILINHLLILASAQPDQLPKYHDRAAQELGAVKKWIQESLTFPNQEPNALELAANFLILCPEYKAEMQELFQSRVRKIVDTLQFSEYPTWLEMLAKLEIIYGSDEFHFGQKGNVIKEPKKARFRTPTVLPERLTA